VAPDGGMFRRMFSAVNPQGASSPVRSTVIVADSPGASCRTGAAASPSAVRKKRPVQKESRRAWVFIKGLDQIAACGALYQ
jgi:hypothetical protein